MKISGSFGVGLGVMFIVCSSGSCTEGLLVWGCLYVSNCPTPETTFPKPKVPLRGHPAFARYMTRRGKILQVERATAVQSQRPINPACMCCLETPSSAGVMKQDTSLRACKIHTATIKLKLMRQNNSSTRNP